jgi:predicted HicB family RNase H-like nuclease
MIRKTTPAFNLRMPPAVRARLEEAAEQNSRSLNAEIVHRLRVSLLEGYRKL